AAVSQPADLGRLCGLDLSDGIAVVLVHRIDPRRRHLPRQSKESGREVYLRTDGDGLARFRAALAPLREGVFTARRPVYAAGALRAHRGELGLLGISDPGLARDHLPAVFRC